MYCFVIIFGVQLYVQIVRTTRIFFIHSVIGIDRDGGEL